MITSLALFVFSGSRAGASAGGTINERVRRGERTSDVTEPPAETPTTRRRRAARRAAASSDHARVVKLVDTLS